MAYTKKTWSDRVVEFPNRYKDQNNNVLSLTRDEGTVSVPGTLVNATVMNNIEDGIEQLSSGWLNATGTFTYASADTPTFVMNTSVDTTSYLSVGMKVKLTQTTAKYFIITAITSSAITLYGGTDYTLTNAVISGVQYSMWKSPFGFPTNPDKWSVKFIANTNFSQLNPDKDFWYNLHSMSVPIGGWVLGYSGTILCNVATSEERVRFMTALSTTNNGASDIELVMYSGVTGAGASGILGFFINPAISKTVNISSKTTYYINARTVRDNTTLLVTDITLQPFIIKAVCAYL